MTLDTILSEQDVFDVISKIFTEFSSKSKVEIEPGSNVGEGFLGVTAAVTVRSDNPKYLFIKMAVQDEILRGVTFQREVFSHEAYFYSKIHPVLNDLFFKYTKKRFEVTPNCIYTSSENLKECIVLDNLMKSGYKLLNTKSCLDNDHVLMVLRTYGCFHACGFILKKENPDFFKELCVKSQDNCYTKFGRLYGFTKLTSKCLDIIKQHYSLDKDILDKLSEIKNKLMNCFESIDNMEDYSSIIHVDCWRNNLMFKYKDNGELEDMKLVDFQMWSVNSPIFDLIHVIHTNAHSEEILNNLKYYLDYYHKFLSKILVDMGGNPEELFPREALSEQWKKHAFYGLFFGLLVTRGLLGGLECMPNIAEYVKANKPLDEVFMFNLPDENEYSRRMKVILRQFIKDKFI